MKARFVLFTTACFVGGVTCLALLTMLVLGRSQVESEIYRQRLDELHGQYVRLADRFETAIRRTAVTELEVRDGVLSVLVRTPEGVIVCIPTPYDPLGTIHVDYIVRDGRLWIRRVYDDDTRPKDGLVIDPKLADIDWRDPLVRHGQTIYRGMLDDGRWIITVTGTGALELARIGPTDDWHLMSAPRLHTHEDLHEEIAQVKRGISTGDILRRAFYAD